MAQRDATALAQALQKLLTSSTLRERLATQARALVKAEFDITQNAAVLRTLFHYQNQTVKTY